MKSQRGSTESTRPCHKRGAGRFLIQSVGGEDGAGERVGLHADQGRLAEPRLQDRAQHNGHRRAFRLLKFVVSSRAA